MLVFLTFVENCHNITEICDRSDLKSFPTFDDILLTNVYLYFVVIRMSQLRVSVFRCISQLVSLSRTLQVITPRYMSSAVRV